MLALKEQKKPERLRAQDQKDIKRLKQELRRKEKALAEAAALLIASKRIMPSGERTGTSVVTRRSPEGPGDPC